MTYEASLNLTRLTDAQLDKRIMYFVREGIDLAALDNALAERAKREAK